MPFAILRTEKLKTPAAVRGAGGHNDRTRNTPNANPRRQNRTLVDGGDDPYQTVLERIAQAGIKKPRKNAVLAQEVLLTASPPFFRPDAPEAYGRWDEDRLEQWCTHAWSWLQERYGDRIVSAHLHLDEATPHIQAIVVPLTDDNRLSARDVFSRWQLRDMQTSYAEALSGLGLQRGIEGSAATHQKVQLYYNLVNKAHNQVPRIIVPKPDPMLKDSKRQDWANFQTLQAQKITSQITTMANNGIIAERQARDSRATNTKLSADLEKEKEERKRLADEVRDIPLEQVLERAGWDRDDEDKNQWRGPNNNGRISLDRHKWYDHDAQVGGGKAIDLTKHVNGSDFTGAVSWLADNFGASGTAAAVRAAAPDQVKTAQAERKPIQIPPAVKKTWPRVREYLIKTRRLAGPLIDSIHKLGLIYGDARGNLVAVMHQQGHKNAPCGAELRGTGDKRFAALAPGSSRNSGSFRVDPAGTSTSDPLVLVESAIDAMSYVEWFNKKRRFTVASTAGARPRVPWLPTDREVIVAYDNDEAGNAAAEALMQNHPGPISRQVPGAKCKDWNEFLQFRREWEGDSRGSEPDWSVPVSDSEADQAPPAAPEDVTPGAAEALPEPESDDPSPEPSP